MVIKYGGSKSETINPLKSSKRVKGSAQKEAEDRGVLPHEWLLDVMLGKPVKQRRVQIVCDAVGNEIHREWVEEDYYADFETRVEAAKSAAPYYASRLASIRSTIDTGSEADKVVEALKDLAEKLPV